MSAVLLAGSMFPTCHAVRCFTDPAWPFLSAAR
jgi:hypothetical protein